MGDETELALGGLEYDYHLMKFINLELRITHHMHPNGGIVNGGGHSGLKDMSHHAIDRSGGAIGQVDKVGAPVTHGVVRLAIAE